MKADDPAIGGEETLYWRAPRLPLENWTIFDEGRGVHRVRGGAFVWNDDGVSNYRHSILQSIGLDWKAIKEAPENGILSVQVKHVRECSLGVAPDPDPPYIELDKLLPRDKAHALIVVEDSVKRRKRSDRCSALARHATIEHWGDAQTNSG